MRVAFVPRYGGPEVVELRQVPTPSPGPGQVRIRVHATTVTAADWRIRSGELPRGFGALRGLALGFGGPRKGVLGTEAAGVIDAIGDGVTRFEVGDRVVAFPGSDLGAHAEYLLVPEQGRVARTPSGLEFAEAASLPFGAMTALDFFRRAAIERGERLLVNGAAGNVGAAAVQLAKHRGAQVTAVTSVRNMGLARSLGADEALDYEAVDFADGVDHFDVIIDTVGNAPYERVRAVLRPGGRLLAVVADLPAMLGAPLVGGPKRHRVIAGPCAERVEDLVEVLELAVSRRLRPVIDTVMPFARIAEAHRLVESRRKRGSVVISFEVS